MKPFLPFLTLLAAAPAWAKAPSSGGAPIPITITAKGGMSWSQNNETITASGDARAVHGNVTVEADQLIAHYRKQSGTAANTAAAKGPGGVLDQEGGKLSKLEAVGHVHIFTPTDNGWGDHAVYDLATKTLVLTGRHIKLTTPQDTITARDSISYNTAQRVAVARGDARIVAHDGRSISADIITGYLAPAAAAKNSAPVGLDQAGNLKKVEAVGHVVIRTTTDTATGERGVYLPQTGKARLGGNVHIIHGKNEMAGSDALVNMKTGTATLLAGKGGQVSGVILPNSGASQ